MTLPASFSSLPHSEFNEFLFASIGEERNGMSLSVISALARLGFDPWKEAARLSELPKSNAAQALAPLIARLPGGGWTLSDTQKIAARVVELLPQGDAARSGRAGREKTISRAGMWLICLALGAAAVFSMAANGGLPFGNDDAFAPVSNTISAQPVHQ